MISKPMTLKEYLLASIVPRYEQFDMAHRSDHALKVIEESLALAEYYEVDKDMVLTIAAYHDTGLCEGRERHHLVSGQIIREDRMLLRWFTPEQIETMAQAAEDHRASLDHEPRSIYGRIVAEADRDIEPLTIVRRTVQYGLSHYPSLDMEGHWQRTLDHLHEKYAEGGYLKLWIPESKNALQLQLLRTLISDEKRLRKCFEKEYSEAGRF